MQSIFFLTKDALSSAAPNPSLVLVPGNLVLLLTATLPVTSRGKLRQALPFALEEQLLEDVTELHFAPGARLETGELPVAVVNKKVMQAWMQQLAEHHIKPEQLLPLTLALPYSQTTWHVFIADLIYVRTGENSGFTCDASNVDWYLQLALEKTAEKPTQVHLHYFSDVQTTLTLSSEIKLVEERHEGDFYKDISRYCAAVSSINLLQNEFAVKKARLPPLKSFTRYSVYLGAIFLTLFTLHPLVSYCLLASKKTGLETQIAEIYHRYYPERKTIAAPVSMLQSKWEQATGNGGDPALALLGEVGQGLKAVKGITIKRLDYQQHQLTLQIAATNAENFANFNEQLSDQGLTVKQQNADLGGGSVNATLIIAQ